MLVSCPRYSRKCRDMIGRNNKFHGLWVTTMAAVILIGCSKSPEPVAEIATGQKAVPTQAPAQPAKAYIDDQRISNAESEPGNWLAHGRTYEEQRFSPLTQNQPGNRFAPGTRLVSGHANDARSRGDSHRRRRNDVHHQYLESGLYARCRHRRTDLGVRIPKCRDNGVDARVVTWSIAGSRCIRVASTSAPSTGA